MTLGERALGNHKLGEHSFVTSVARDDLAKLRRRYADLGEALQDDFVQRFEAFGSVDELFARYPLELDAALRRTTAYAVEDITAHGIYHWDEPALRSRLEVCASDAFASFERIEQDFLSITRAADDREMLRAEAGQSRPMIIGGGFGVEGAARGIIAATAVNAAVGLVQGTANAVGKAIATGGDKRRKEALFQAATTREGLSEVLFEITLAGHRLVADVVNEEREGEKFEVISDAANRRAKAVIANVQAQRVPSDEVPEVLIEALQLDPFLDDGWKIWIELIGDYDGSVVDAAQQFITNDLDQHKQILFENQSSILEWSTPEESLSNIAALEVHARFYGIPFAPLKQKIEDYAATLDEQRRTFSGTVYDSVQDMEAAKVDAAEVAQRTVGGAVFDSDSEAAEARDLQTRTFNGKVYLSDRAAIKAKQRYLRANHKFYWLLIFIAPFPSALITTQHEYSRTQRIIAFGWLIVYWAFSVFSMDLFGMIALLVLGLIATVILITMAEIDIRIGQKAGSKASVTERSKGTTAGRV